MKKYRPYIKAADMLLKALSELRQIRLQQLQNDFEELKSRYSGIAKKMNYYRDCIGKNWYSAAENMRSGMAVGLNEYVFHLERFRDTINAEKVNFPAQRVILDELLQSEKEFGGIGININSKTISVTTEPITLNDISLGRFEIRLYLDSIRKTPLESPYRIIALEPNASASDSDVTHPHVSGERLCEGDGYVLIRNSIQQGRLFDFFMIIVQILQTYNPESPYVSLDDWGGVACHDCGHTVSGDDHYCCEDCQRDFCSSCSTYCQICDITLCLACSIECPSCKEPVCTDCSSVCVDCEERFCKDCINEAGLCKNCQKQREEQEHEEAEEAA